MKKILTIAASDSGGGAGIQADIKTITVLGGFAMSAVTALTAQNTLSVKAVHPVPPAFVASQISTVLDDIGADAVKTGMLVNKDIVATVAEALQRYRPRHIVIDPVMKSKSGNTLLERSAVEVLIAELLPVATLVTPNLDEASLLCGMRIDSVATMKKAAERMAAMGPRNVLIKGGHLEGDCTDIFFDGQEFAEFSSPRIDTKNTHGTGCTLSAAIAACLAQGALPREAVNAAKAFITTAIRCAVPLGQGHGPTNHFAPVQRNAHITQCCSELKNAFEMLRCANIGHLIPEVQSNLGYAVPAAAVSDDVIAFPGRIIRLGETITTVAAPAPGGSRHIAKIILTALTYDGRYRSAMNITWNDALIDHCRKAGFSVCEFDRKQEPPEVKQREGSTLEWGTNNVLAARKEVPDIIYDRGDLGKEPMTRVLGTDPMDVADKIIKLADMRNR